MIIMKTPVTNHYPVSDAHCSEFENCSHRHWFLENKNRTKWRLSVTFYYCASDIHCERAILVSCGLAPIPLKQTWASFNYHLPKEYFHPSGSHQGQAEMLLRDRAHRPLPWPGSPFPTEEFSGLKLIAGIIEGPWLKPSTWDIFWGTRGGRRDACLGSWQI